MTRPVVVYVSGAPGSGKSTLAAPLAELLGFALVSKDVLKESLFDSLPAVGDPLAWSRTLGAAAMELLWTLGRQPAPVVLEANFRPRSEYERSRLLGLGRPLVEVWCDCPSSVAADRFAARAESSARRHDVHPIRSHPDGLLAEFDGPVGLGPLVRVDTTVPMDVGAVTDAVLAALARATPIGG